MAETRIDDVFVEALQSIAEGVVDVVGFEVAVISIRRDDDTLEVIAVAGSNEAREELLGRRTSIGEIEKEISSAEDWGDLRFVPYERMSTELEGVGWVPDIEVGKGPESWHPLDLLLAPLYDEHGKLRGLMSVDLPLDRRRPGPKKRLQLQRFARQTRRAVITALERRELAEKVRLADSARKIVREVSADLSIDRIVERSNPALCEAFEAAGLWIQTFDEDGEGTGAIHTYSGREVVLTDDLRQVAYGVARLLWSIQDVAVIDDKLPEGWTTREESRQITDFMSDIGISSMLAVPLGAGREVLGCLVLTRHGGNLDWTTIEKQAAMDIGHDLGRALINARTLERERRLVEELRELDGYKSRLIATIAHELKNPLTSILGHAEMLESAPDLTGSVRNSISSMERGTIRMQRLIDDLLVLARAGDPQVAFVPVPVDLTAVLTDVLDLLHLTIESKNLKVVLETPEQPVMVYGEASGIDQICANLISNAAKYTPEAGTITISLEHRVKDVELRVADTGLGISESDQMQLFQEFFRSTNPAAVALPGTGLGLTIMQRIVERHGGRISFDSELKVGTTFTVTLPAATDRLTDRRTDEPVRPEAPAPSIRRCQSSSLPPPNSCTMP